MTSSSSLNRFWNAILLRTPDCLWKISIEKYFLENSQMARLKEDVDAKFQAARATFQEAGDTAGEQEYLQLFAFICELSFDVYLKKQMIEALADQLRSEEPPAEKRKK